LIVRTTPQLDVLDAGLATGSERCHMMELEEPARVAASFIPADERAPAVVALPDHPPHRGGDVTCTVPLVGRRAARRDAT
jgi:hypothetical protein